MILILSFVAALFMAVVHLCWVDRRLGARRGVFLSLERYHEKFLETLWVCSWALWLHQRS